MYDPLQEVSILVFDGLKQPREARKCFLCCVEEGYLYFRVRYHRTISTPHNMEYRSN